MMPYDDALGRLIGADEREHDALLSLLRGVETDSECHRRCMTAVALDYAVARGFDKPGPGRPTELIILAWMAMTQNFFTAEPHAVAGQSGMDDGAMH
jgi:hypothetical protein